MPEIEIEQIAIRRTFTRMCRYRPTYMYAVHCQRSYDLDRVVILLCGGNIDTTVLGRCLERGLAADGRLVRFVVTVSDRPGSIAELTRRIASIGVWWVRYVWQLELRQTNKSQQDLAYACLLHYRVGLFALKLFHGTKKKDYRHHVFNT